MTKQHHLNWSILCFCVKIVESYRTLQMDVWPPWVLDTLNEHPTHVTLGIPW